MTRINLVEPSQLTDKHLLAEYKEITRPFNKVIKRIEKYGVDKALDNVTIPEKYVLGAGHESFFFDKLCWLYFRYNDLFLELLERGFSIDREKYMGIVHHFHDTLAETPYWNVYKPTPEEFYLNMARLCKRSKLQSVEDELDSDN